MLKIDRISKSFRGRQALAPLEVEIAEGEIFGFLGHNGAGKSTTFGILLGHLKPDSGDVTIRGNSVRQNRAAALARVGAIFEAPAFYDYLSGWRNLELLVGLSGVPDPSAMRDVVDLVGLSERIREPVRVYSHGMRQRLALAQALLPGPELIILDEPSDGLDPEGIQEMRRLILRLRAERGMTIIFSSHLLVEAEQVCDRVGILREGRLVYCGAWRDQESVRVRFDVDDWDRATGVLTRFGAKFGPGQTASFEREIATADVISAMVHEGIRVSAATPERASLEDFYMEHTGG